MAICDSCGGERTDTADRPNGCAECLVCWRSALAHGHLHGLHTDDDSDPLYNAVPDCPSCTGRIYRIRVISFDPHTEEVREYPAVSLSEALSMAERDDAGIRNVTYGIPPELYAIARFEDIAFNDADGLLLDHPF
jgi:hypothetical protein